MDNLEGLGDTKCCISIEYPEVTKYPRAIDTRGRPIKINIWKKVYLILYFLYFKLNHQAEYPI